MALREQTFQVKGRQIFNAIPGYLGKMTKCQDSTWPVPGEGAGRAKCMGADAWGLHGRGPDFQLNLGPGEETTCSGREDLRCSLSWPTTASGYKVAAMVMSLKVSLRPLFGIHLDSGTWYVLSDSVYVSSDTVNVLSYTVFVHADTVYVCSDTVYVLYGRMKLPTKS